MNNFDLSKKIQLSKDVLLGSLTELTNVNPKNFLDNLKVLEL